MSNASQDPFPFPEKAKELQALLRARLERELGELRRFLGDSPERLRVLQEPPIEGGPLPQTVGEVLSAVERNPEVLATATALELETCARMVVRPGLLGAVLSRPRVAEGWPWPEWWLCLERRIRSGARWGRSKRSFEPQTTPLSSSGSSPKRSSTAKPEVVWYGFSSASHCSMRPKPR